MRIESREKHLGDVSQLTFADLLKRITKGPFRLDDEYLTTEIRMLSNGNVVMAMWPLLEDSPAIGLGSSILLRNHQINRQRMTDAEFTKRALNNVAELADVLRAALLESGCDGDLCARAWHEDARRVLTRLDGQE